MVGMHGAAAAAGAPWADPLSEVIPMIVDASGIVEPADDAGRAVAARPVPTLLADLPSRARFEPVLAAVA